MNESNTKCYEVRSTESSITILAVYGTLKAGYSNHSLISKGKYLGTGITKPEYDMLSFVSYPGVIKGNKSIMVELYAVTPEILKRIDQLEGHPNFYRRTPIAITMNKGSRIEAEMYTLSHRNMEDYDSSLHSSEVNIFSDCLYW